MFPINIFIDLHPVITKLIQYSFSLVAAIVALTLGIKLYIYYQNIRKIYPFNQPNENPVSLVYISKLTWGTIMLSISYLMAQTIDIFVPNDEFHDLIWPLLEGMIFIIFSSLCWYSDGLVRKEFKYDALRRQNKIIKAMVAAAGGYVWYKDSKGRYLYCDPTWCDFFFGMKDTCDIVGMDDAELLDAFRESKKIRHTFGDLCMNTDFHARDQGKQCRYVECGYIGDKLIVLDVLKTPLFEEGIYVGTVGFAWERANECEHIFKDIEKYLKTGKAERLSDGVYWIHTAATECKWDKPFPGSR